MAGKQLRAEVQCEAAAAAVGGERGERGRASGEGRAEAGQVRHAARGHVQAGAVKLCFAIRHPCPEECFAICLPQAL